MRTKISIAVSVLALSLGAVPVAIATADEPTLGVTVPLLQTPTLAAGDTDTLSQVRSAAEQLVADVPIDVVGSEPAGVVNQPDAIRTAPAPSSPTPDAQASVQRGQAQEPSPCCVGGAALAQQDGGGATKARESENARRAGTGAGAQAHAARNGDLAARRRGRDGGRAARPSGSRRTAASAPPRWSWERYPALRDGEPSLLPRFGGSSATGSLPWKAWVIATLGGLLVLSGVRLRQLAR